MKNGTRIIKKLEEIIYLCLFKKKEEEIIYNLVVEIEVVEN